MAPSCVPASALESPRGALNVADMARILEHERAIGVAEVMDFPSVIAGDPDVLAKVALHPHVDGHAPGVAGRGLDAYAATGIASDHEATTWEEALEKRRRGIWVLLREASNARNLVDLLELVRRYGPEYCAFCTDDQEPDELLRVGHIDAMCRTAVAHGIAPEDVLVMASLHGARCHGLADLGAIAPGYRADMVVLDDLEGFGAALVIADGRVAARDGVAVPFAAPEVPGWVRDTVRIAALGDAPFDLGPAGGGDVRVMGIVPGQLITTEAHEPPPVAGGRIVRRPGARPRQARRRRAPPRDRAHRHRASCAASACGAARSPPRSRTTRTTSWSSASTTRACVACVERLAELGGGIAVADGGAVRGELALPVAGLLSDAPAEEVVARVDALVALLAEQGVRIDAPFMTLSFLALSVIPELKLTDRGLVDVVGARVVGLAVLAHSTTESTTVCFRPRKKMPGSVSNPSLGLRRRVEERISSVPVRSLLTKNTAPPPSRAWLRRIRVRASSTRKSLPSV